MEKNSFQTLLLMRHGDAAGSPDRERILTETGVAQCRAVARIMAEKSISPDFILCSGLRRTRETLAALGLEHLPTIFCGDDLYHADHTADILRVIGEYVPADAHAPLVIGHNPTMHMAVCDLAGPNENEHFMKIASHYSPATVSIFSVDWENWLSPRRTGICLDQVIQPDF